MRTIVTILLMMFLAQTTKAQEFIFETTKFYKINNYLLIK